MIFKALKVRNFGIFDDENGPFDLEPDVVHSKRKPIILFTGDNGSGKTTLFEAISLCIYGPYFRGKRMSQSEYESYLTDRLHRRPNGARRKDASVNLTFSYSERGERTDFELARSWTLSSRRKVADRLSLVMIEDGCRRQLANPQEFLLGLFPVGFSQLLFFDGERIKSFAENGEPNRLFRDGFRSLVGAEIVESTRRDLAIYAARLQSGPSKNPRTKYADLGRKIENLSHRADKTRNEIEQMHQRAELVRGRIAEDEQALAREGAEYAKHRNELLVNKVRLEVEKDALRRQLARLCDEHLPFVFAPELGQRTIESLKREINAQSIGVTARSLKVVQSNLHELLASGDFWEGLDLDGQSIAAISGRVICAMEQLLPVPPEPALMYHDLSYTDAQRVIDSLEEALAKTREEGMKVVLQYVEASDTLSDIEDQIDKIPPEEALIPIVSDLRAHMKESADLQASMDELLAELENLEHMISENKALQDAELDNLGIEAKRNRRVRLSVAATKVLNEFAQYLISTRMRELEEVFTSVFNKLQPPAKWLQRVDVDPDNLTAALVGKDGHESSSAVLSAGEKQVYAISLLGAITKVSSRKFPFVIDTPLARLDKKHRKAFASGFIPAVSDQVIMFATNTEMTKTVRTIIAPFLCREIRLRFDSSRSSAAHKIIGGI